MKYFFLLAVYWSMYSNREIICVEPVVNMRIRRFIEKTNCPLDEFPGRVIVSHAWTTTMRPRREREGLWEWRNISLGQETRCSWHAMKRAILHVPSIPENKGQFLTQISRELRESSATGILHYGLGSRRVLIRTGYITQGHLGWVAEAGRVKENELWKGCKITVCAAY